MENIYLKIKGNEELNEVDTRILSEIFKKDIVSVRELVDELLDYKDQIARSKEVEEESELNEQFDEDRNTLAYVTNMERND